MARNGIYKSDVVEARNKLMAEGRNPSIDAIRVEMGNTGSKATIHRYLKEIEEEQAGTKISEPLQILVAKLSERLNWEADKKIAEQKSAHAAELAKCHQQKQVVEKEMAELRASLAAAAKELEDTQAELKEVSERLSQETMASALANRRLTDMRDLLSVEEKHRESLEEKHTHAREALEHFRTASQQQREQEHRLHEQQLQYLKGEIKTLQTSVIQAQHDSAASKEASARLSANLAKAERALFDAKEELRGLKSAQADFVSAQRAVERLETQVVQLQTALEGERSRNVELEATHVEDRAEVHELQVRLAAARAAMDAQNDLAQKIQTLMVQQPKAGSTRSAQRR